MNVLLLLMKEFKQAGPEWQPSGANMIFNPGHNLHFQSVNAILWMSILGHMETIQHTGGPTSKPYEHRRTHPQAIC